MKTDVSKNDAELASLWIERLMTKQADAGKWLLGSLLIINGGALIALFSNEKVGPAMLEASAMYFVAGIILAVFTGAASYVVSDSVLAHFFRALDFKLNPIKSEDNPKDQQIFLIVAFIVMILLAASSLGCFGYGAYAAADAAYGKSLDLENAISNVEAAADALQANAHALSNDLN